MKRTFREASIRGCNKYVIKGLLGVTKRLDNLSEGLLTVEELCLIDSIKSNIAKLSNNDRFDRATAELGFKVYRFDFLIIENGIPYERINQTNTSYLFWKKQAKENKNIRIKITDKYLLK